MQRCEHVPRIPDLYWLGNMCERPHMRTDDNLWYRTDVRGWATDLCEYGLVRFTHEHLPGVANLQRRRNLQPDTDLYVDRADLRSLSRNLSGCAYLRPGPNLQQHGNMSLHADLRRIPDLSGATVWNT